MHNTEGPWGLNQLTTIFRIRFASVVQRVNIVPYVVFIHNEAADWGRERSQSTRDNAFFQRARSVDKAPRVLWNLYLPWADRNRVSSEGTRVVCIYAIEICRCERVLLEEREDDYKSAGQFVLTCKQEASAPMKRECSIWHAWLCSFIIFEIQYKLAR